MEDKQVQNLGRILDSAESLLTLINEILDLSRVEAGRVDVFPSVMNPRELAHEVRATMRPIAKEKGISLKLNDEDAPADGVQDEEKLKQILLNLVSNAVKFTEAGAVVLTVGGDGDDLVFGVEDTGIGIPPEAIDHIFEEFRQVDGSTTRRFGGTGLGLAISNRLATLVGGTITVESEVGRGSTFTVRVPRHLESPNAGEAPA